MELYKKDRICVKCGEAGASVRWCRSKAHAPDGSACKKLHYYGEIKAAVVRGQHMERVCKNCGYEWIERTLDSGAPLEQLAAQAE